MRQKFLILTFCALICFLSNSEICIAKNTVSGGDVNNLSEQENIEVTELDLGDYSSEMAVGEKQLLNVTVLPFTATERTCSYTSSIPEVATVNGLGRIIASKVGSTEIKAVCGGKSASFVLKVVESRDIKVTDIEIADYQQELEVGRTMRLSTTIQPLEASNNTIKYWSADPSIATVSSSGEVKGIAKGSVKIYISAGDVTKEVSIAVNVATSKIEVNKDYLVLKPQASFQLSASVKPAEATQEITYSSVDKEIATVDETGLVTAKNNGSTSIIVSNGDITISISVIVNQDAEVIEEPTIPLEQDTSGISLPDQMNASLYKKLSKDMLHYFYRLQKTFEIIGQGYRMEIDGSSILNYTNELYTDIALEKDGQGTHFEINKSQSLCGEIILYLEDYEGEYLYLFNQSKGKYELLDVDDFSRLKITSPGKYLITHEKIGRITGGIRMIILIGSIGIILGSVTFVALKRRYWFW